jgi:serine/threonine protein kinase
MAVGGAQHTSIETNVSCARGKFISGGASGIVERLPSGDVIKSPWAGSQADVSRQGLTTEARIYEVLGPHPRLVRIVDWEATECCLTMEYMSNGTLKDYLRAHNDEIAISQRLGWILEAAEGLQLLHSADIIHCDVEPKNFLLDTDLSLKIADFGGSSLHGSQPLACAGTRFWPPGKAWDCMPTVQDDLFALGSAIYTIVSGRYPFQELASDDVVKRYEAHEWPDVTAMVCGDVVRRCWQREVDSARDVCDMVIEIIAQLRCKIISTVSSRKIMLSLLQVIN